MQNPVLKTNFHTHTRFCDGTDTAEDIVKYAISHGFTHLGFSGHLDADIHVDVPEYFREIRRLQTEYKDRIDIFCGVELDTLYDPAKAQGAEYIIGSTHFLDVPAEIPISVDNSPEMMARLCDEFFGGDYYKLAKAYFELEAQVYDRTKCTFVGHFDLVTRFNDQMGFLDESDRRYLFPAMEAMSYLVMEGVPFEINCGAVNRGRKKELYPNMALLKVLQGFGGEILINSDAHQKELLNGAFDLAIEAARAAGFDHVNILAHAGDGKVKLVPVGI